MQQEYLMVYYKQKMCNKKKYNVDIIKINIHKKINKTCINKKKYIWSQCI
jgi:hypothetical protein